MVNILWVGTLALVALVYYTYQYGKERGPLCAIFYAGSILIIWTIAATDRLPWYCILALIIGQCIVIQGFPKTEE